MEYEPLSEVKPIAGAFKGKGPAKRKHDEIEDDQGDNDMDDEEMDDLLQQALT